MHGVIVTRAPEKAMLRHGEDYSTARRIALYICASASSSSASAPAHRRPHRHQTRPRGECRTLHLILLRPAGAIVRTRVRRGKFRCQQCAYGKFLRIPENKSSSATNFKKTPRIRKIFTQRPLDELISRAKPKISFLESGKPQEDLGVKSGASVGRIFGETDKAVDAFRVDDRSAGNSILRRRNDVRTRSNVSSRTHAPSHLSNDTSAGNSPTKFLQGLLNWIIAHVHWPKGTLRKTSRDAHTIKCKSGI